MREMQRKCFRWFRKYIGRLWKCSRNTCDVYEALRRFWKGPKKFNYCTTIICSPHHTYLLGDTSKPMALGVYFLLLRTSTKILLFVVSFILFYLSINSYHTMQFTLVTSRTRSLTPFLKRWKQECVVFCVRVPMTLFAGRTPYGLINLGSQIEENIYSYVTSSLYLGVTQPLLQERENPPPQLGR